MEWQQYGGHPAEQGLGSWCLLRTPGTERRHAPLAGREQAEPDGPERGTTPNQACRSPGFAASVTEVFMIWTEHELRSEGSRDNYGKEILIVYQRKNSRWNPHPKPRITLARICLYHNSVLLRNCAPPSSMGIGKRAIG